MRTKLMLVLAALMTLPMQTALAQSTDRPAYGHGFWGGHWDGWFMGPVMMLILIAVVVVVVAGGAVVVVVSGSSSRGFR